MWILYFDLGMSDSYSSHFCFTGNIFFFWRVLSCRAGKTTYTWPRFKKAPLLNYFKSFFHDSNIFKYFRLLITLNYLISNWFLIFITLVIKVMKNIFFNIIKFYNKYKNDHIKICKRWFIDLCYLGCIPMPVVSMLTTKWNTWADASCFNDINVQGLKIFVVQERWFE